MCSRISVDCKRVMTMSKDLRGNKNRINNPKPKILQFFCRHKCSWYRTKTLYHNLAGETQYKVCTKCGAVVDTRFIPNWDGS